MQVDEPGTVVEVGNVNNKFLAAYLDKNNIYKAGCRWLSKGNWKKICKIYLSKNVIIRLKLMFLERLQMFE